ICRPAIELEATQDPMENARLHRAGHFTEAMMIFEDVFVPWDQVLVYKNETVASRLALGFALYHRFTAISYRACLASHLVGIARLMSQYNGIDKVPHIIQQIAQLITYAEMQNVCAKMAALECTIEPTTGFALPNAQHTNLGKLFSNSGHMGAKQALIDICGGLAVNAPGAEDYQNPELREDIDKYLAGGNGVSGIQRFKLFVAVRELLAIYGGLEDVGELHAEGSMWPSVLELWRSYDYREVEEKILAQL
ncbi:MAG: 4-hydroxyphenylacetate 3-hydroxylase C-terminal domain-containing protein, partial [Parahaliea sp.]